MRVLVDTNILLDFYAKREDFYDDSNNLLNKLIEDRHKIFVAAYTIPTIGYVLRKNYTLDEIKLITNDIITISDIIPLNKTIIVNANNSSIKDYEDAFMEASAIIYNVDYIVTRNIKDFENSKVKTILPKDLLTLLNI